MSGVGSGREGAPSERRPVGALRAEDGQAQ